MANQTTITIDTAVLETVIALIESATSELNDAKSGMNWQQAEDASITVDQALCFIESVRSAMPATPERGEPCF